MTRMMISLYMVLLKNVFCICIILLKRPHDLIYIYIYIYTIKYLVIGFTKKNNLVNFI